MKSRSNKKEETIYIKTKFFEPKKKEHFIHCIKLQLYYFQTVDYDYLTAFASLLNKQKQKNEINQCCQTQYIYWLQYRYQLNSDGLDSEPVEVLRKDHLEKSRMFKMHEMRL